MTLRFSVGPPADKQSQIEHENYAYALIFGNMLLTGLVALVFVLDIQHTKTLKLAACEPGHTASYCSPLKAMFELPAPGSHVLDFFIFLECIAGSLYWVHGFLPENLYRRIADAISKSSVDPDTDLYDKKGLHFPLWVTVLPNVAAIGYLVYATGGPSASPYAQVFISILIISQQTKQVEIVGRRGLTVDFRASGRAYAPFLLIAAMFYLALGVLQLVHSARVASAPGGLSVFIALTLLVVGTLVNYLISQERTTDGTIVTEHEPPPTTQGDG